MSPELVHYAVDRAIATVTLDSPENRNALSAQLVGELSAHLQAAAADGAVRAVVLAHTGTTFCAGADLNEAAAEGGPEQATTRMLALLRSIVELPKPVIARIEGHVRAGGLGIVGACDIAVAGPASSFAFTEVRLGLAPAIISLTTLGRMSERAAARYYLTGEPFDAPTAAAAGLITTAVDDVDVEVAAITEALRGCSPQGLAETKPLTTIGAVVAFEQRAEQVHRQSARLFGSDEAREGMTAFLQRRPPSWAAPA
ncbi:MAG: enoyl-CoA hydratase family protein [Pseudonocardiales bacterium]|nr:MAG: enoyl-CoA hydratase family protein [Pseudonocardiales bacterium]